MSISQPCMTMSDRFTRHKSRVYEPICSEMTDEDDGEVIHISMLNAGSPFSDLIVLRAVLRVQSFFWRNYQIVRQTFRIFSSCLN